MQVSGIVSRWYSMSQLCSICHDIPVILHNPGAYGQCSMLDHSIDKQLVVIGTRYNTWWPIRSRVITNSSALVKCWNFYGCPRFHKAEISAVHSYIPLGLNQLLNVGVEQWLQICSGDLPVGLCKDCQGSLLLLGPLFHYPQCHNGLVFGRNEHVCLCHSITRAGSWYGK